VAPGARAAWAQLVAAALERIRAGALAKVVVARAQDVRAATPFDGPRLLELLTERHPTCRAFLVQGDAPAGERAPFLIGATPELLCRIEGRELRTEAVAGSSPPGEAASLLGNQKELREHRWVVDHLLSGLSPLCESVALPPEPGLRVLTHVAHLATPVVARLLPGVGPAEVVAALHPTPAVCGEPARAALGFLAQRERLGRGLYAGLVGLLGERCTELAVALRSALVRGRDARVFAGAGLVEGSRADDELRETDLKTAALLQALAACAPLEERP
jgi:salicylate biosynthesis isochorismate synthase/menaquinone-specific isochorismate synthase